MGMQTFASENYQLSISAGEADEQNRKLGKFKSGVGHMAEPLMGSELLLWMIKGVFLKRKSVLMGLLLLILLNR